MKKYNLVGVKLKYQIKSNKTLENYKNMKYPVKGKSLFVCLFVYFFFFSVFDQNQEQSPLGIAVGFFQVKCFACFTGNLISWLCLWTFDFKYFRPIDIPFPKVRGEFWVMSFMFYRWASGFLVYIHINTEDWIKFKKIPRKSL